MSHAWFRGAPFRTCSSFSTLAFLDRWARGQGSHYLDWVHRYFERKARQGIVAQRVIETVDWDDRDDNPDNNHPYFNEHRAASQQLWDYNQLRIQARPHRLTSHHQRVLLKLMELGYEHGQRIEYTVDGTLKHSPNVGGWLVIGHCIRQVADFCKNVDRGTWIDVNEHPEGGMGSATDPVAHADINALFERVVEFGKRSPLHDEFALEGHNEIEAHSLAVWRSTTEHRPDGSVLAWETLPLDELRRKAFAEVNAQIRRMREEESHWPEGAFWVSQGGNDGQGADLFEYDHRLADAIAFHSSRPNMDVGGRFDHITRAAEKLGSVAYNNEIIHDIDRAFWWTAEQGWFRPGSSTKDAARRHQFVEEMLEKGIVVCEHGLVEMSSGMWWDGSSWTEMPLSETEKILLAENGGGGLPPPEPIARYRYEPIVRLAYEQILGRSPDEEGLKNYDGLMSSGMTEANVRESLIRSPEYEANNPED